MGDCTDAFIRHVDAVGHLVKTKMTTMAMVSKKMRRILKKMKTI